MNTQSIKAGSSGTTREGWKNTILAGLANYIDGGSIVAGAAALALWTRLYNLSPSFVGIIGAFSANAIAAGIGALIGGRLCDLYGRKKIYQYDMLFYAFGMCWLVFAVQPWMIVLGFVLVGLAVGADIPASWSLIAETAPEGQRGKHSGVAQVLWLLGPLVVLLMSLVVAPLGITGSRIVFGHLLILSLALTVLRSRMKESPIWEAAKRAKDENSAVRTLEAASIRKLFEPKHFKAMLFLSGMYGIWNLWSGTVGFFFPYILSTVGAQSQAVAVGLQAAGTAIGIASLIFVFMRLSDRVNQRLLFGLSALIQVIGMSLLAIFPLTLPVVIVYLVLVSLGGIIVQAFFQLWSAELFPTLLRSTAQGLTFAVVRIAMGIWSFVVPVLASSQFSTFAWILTGFLILSGLIGVIWGPRNEGKSLSEIEAERNSPSLQESGAIESSEQAASLPKRTF
jgi:inositol transporter-like SP family MFS transporter